MCLATHPFDPHLTRPTRSFCASRPISISVLGWGHCYTKKRETLQRLQQRLRAIHAGGFEDDAYLRPWITPTTADPLLDHAVEMQPGASGDPRQRILYEEGRSLDCHRNALEYATANGTATAWFGFSLSLECSWLHSWVLEEDGNLD